MGRLPALPRHRWLEGQVLGTAWSCSLPRHCQQDLVWGGSNKGVILPCPVVSLVYQGGFVGALEGWRLPSVPLQHGGAGERSRLGAACTGTAATPCPTAAAAAWGQPGTMPVLWSQLVPVGPQALPKVSGHGAVRGRCGSRRPHPRAVADATQGPGCPGSEQEAGAGGGGGARGARRGAVGE